MNNCRNLLKILFCCLPLFLLNRTSSAQSNIINFKGNYFFMGSRPNDTVTEIMPNTGDEVMKIINYDPDPVPLKMNDSRIYTWHVLATKPETDVHNIPFELYVLKEISNELGKLPDGDYFLDLDHVVINKKGKVVYYQYPGIYNKELSDAEVAKGANIQYILIPPAIKGPLNKKIERTLCNAPAAKPGLLNGKPVVVATNISLDKYRITITAHKASFSLK